MSNDTDLEKLNSLFGSYKAEWLRSKIFDLFAEPSYFPELKDNRPCVLEGGRGTGKTTVLRVCHIRDNLPWSKKILSCLTTMII